MAGSMLPLAPDGFAGRQLGKYEVLCRLSTGGMAEIFLASQRGLAGFRKLVVLKQILPDIRGEEEFVRMFLDEAKVTAAFNHPNIAQVFDLDIADGELFLAMEFVPGATLVEVAKAARTAGIGIPVGYSLAAVRDTAVALHYAHTFTDPLGRPSPVIHRDIAEKNIMVTYEGVTKLLDFGIAKNLSRASRTQVGMVKGTSGYMSPEQIMGEPLDARSDLFSLGVVLHECLTGMRLFYGRTPEAAMNAVLNGEVPPPSRANKAVPPELDAIVLKALARNREERYATTLEFARALDRSVGGLIWHPEQSGELMQRLFDARREQTRQLLASGQMGSADFTGEIRLSQLFGTDGPSAPPAPAPRAEPPPPETPPLAQGRAPATPSRGASAPRATQTSLPLPGSAPTAPGIPSPRRYTGISAQTLPATESPIRPEAPPRAETPPRAEDAPGTSSVTRRTRSPLPPEPAAPPPPPRRGTSDATLQALPPPAPAEDVSAVRRPSEGTRRAAPPPPPSEAARPPPPPAEAPRPPPPPPEPPRAAASSKSRPAIEPPPDDDLDDEVTVLAEGTAWGSRRPVPAPAPLSARDLDEESTTRPHTTARFDSSDESDASTIISHDPAERTQPSLAAVGVEQDESTDASARPVRSYRWVGAVVGLLLLVGVGVLVALRMDGGLISSALPTLSELSSPSTNPGDLKPLPEAAPEPRPAPPPVQVAPAQPAAPTAAQPPAAPPPAPSAPDDALPSLETPPPASASAPKPAPTAEGPAVEDPLATTKRPRAPKKGKRTDAAAEDSEAPKEPGYLTLVIEPYAKVYLSGRLLGETPLFRVSLPAGRHSLRLVGPDGQPRRLSVDIKPSDTTSLRMPLELLARD